MCQILKTIEEENDLTTMTVTGKVSLGELIEALKDFYNGRYTMKLLWDFSGADLAEISSEHLYMLVSFSKSYGHLRKGGKTAFVLAGGFEFGLGRMFETLSVLHQHTVLYNVFKKKDEAEAWLQG